MPGERVRKMEIKANEAFDVYRELYYEGGVSSVYFWNLDDGFAGVVLLKKCELSLTLLLLWFDLGWTTKDVWMDGHTTDTIMLTPLLLNSLPNQPLLLGRVGLHPRLRSLGARPHLQLPPYLDRHPLAGHQGQRPRRG